ncbi:MAG TPA: right-handed parallel beta-helix repeat-containing protein [Candidatus Paceibacterota bacterium]|nr:right-handed parallel beta-helix repeat-containing protein [Candidatus Paceibacterota bacterium]
MENRGRIIQVAILAVALLLPGAAFAYEPNSTHDVLTLESARFYNEHHEKFETPRLSEEMILRLRSGAVHEDDDMRMAHHFYDPIYDRGFKQYVSSKTWAELPVFQGSWGDSKRALNALVLPPATAENDFSWQRAIYEYTYGDKGRAFEALGHTLHLIEDASVPDHTRNDAHIPIIDGAINSVMGAEYQQKSPFEEFADRFSVSAGNVETSRELLGLKRDPYMRNSLGAYFDNAAMYSNTNFYSKSTIGSLAYELPYIQKEETQLIGGQKYKFGFYNEHVLALISESIDTSGNKVIGYSIVDPNKLVLSAYWSLTSKEAVLNASGVIHLFFVEVEKERQSGEIYRIYNTPPLQKTAISGVQMVGAAGDVARQPVIGAMFGYDRALKIAGQYTTSGIAFVGEIGTYAKGKVTGTMLAFNLERNNPFQNSAPVAPVVQPQFAETVATTTLLATKPALHTPIQPFSSSSTSPSSPSVQRTTLAAIEAALRALLAEAAAMQQASAIAGTSTLALDDADLPVGETLALMPPAVRIDEGVPSGSSPSAAASFFVILASLDGASSPLPITEPEEEPIEELATSTDDSENATSTPPADTTAPDTPTITAPAADTILEETIFTLAGTAEASSTLLISWMENDHATVLSLRVPESGLWEAELEFPEGETEVRIAARDDAGNLSGEAAQMINITLPPSLPVARAPLAGDLLFNEFLFPCLSDEAIEIANTTNDLILLDGVRLASSDPSIDMTLSGSIAPHGFHTLAVSLTGTLGLTDIGPSTQVFRTGPLPPLTHDLATYTLAGPAGEPLDTTAHDRKSWCQRQPGRTVEKRSPSDLSDTHAFDRHHPFIQNGIASNGTPLYSTFGKRNSRSYIMPAINADLELSAAGGPYIIWDASKLVPVGATLTLGPGVHVYFFAQDPTQIPGSYRPELLIDGVLRVLGTADAPVRFASFEDSAAREDFNLADLAAPRSYGDIIFRPGSEGEITYAEFAHLGTNALTFDAASGTLTHVRLEDSRSGIRADNGAIVVGEDVLLRDLDTSALALEGGSLAVLASTTLEQVTNAGFSVAEGSVLILDGVAADDVGGAAIRADGGSVVSVTDAELSSVRGSAAFLFGATLEVSSSTLAGSPNGAGILAIQSDVIVASSTITDNRVGIEAHASNVLVTSSTVSGNGTNIVNDGSTIIVAP